MSIKPFTRLTTIPASGALPRSYYDLQEGNRTQPLMRSIPLRYHRKKVLRLSFTQVGGYPTPDVLVNDIYFPTCGNVNTLAGPLDPSSGMREVYNKAYGKLRDRVLTRAEMLTFAVERASTAAMVTNRVTQLFRGYTALRRGRFSEFLRIFGLKPLARHKGRRSNKPKEASGLWLEYWMGWAPTCADLAQAYDNWFREDLPRPRVKATAGRRLTLRDYRKSGSNVWTGSGSELQLAKLQCRVRISNPDAFMASQQGVVNPMLTGFQVLPWSWMLGWFVNLEQVISSCTDWVGLELTECQAHFKVVSERQTDYRYNSIHQTHNRLVVESRRVLYPNGFPRPYLVWTVPGVSWTRAATVVSLLVQRLKD